MHIVCVKVVAPVRETVSQTLASLLIHMPRRSLLHVHSVLLQMIRQHFAVPADNKTKNDMERPHSEPGKSISAAFEPHIIVSVDVQESWVGSFVTPSPG